MTVVERPATAALAQQLPVWPGPPRQQRGARTAVLPYPAGAQTSTSPRASPSSSRPARRGRGTKPGRGRGRCSLVASTSSCPEIVTSPADAARVSAIGDPLLSASSNGPASPLGVISLPGRAGGTLVPAHWPVKVPLDRYTFG